MWHMACVVLEVDELTNLNSQQISFHKVRAYAMLSNVHRHFFGWHIKNVMSLE